MGKKYLKILAIALSSIAYVTVFYAKKDVYFTCHQIAGDKVATHADRSKGIFVDIDQNGHVKAIHDGKRTPLILGSIPSKQHHVDQLKKIGNIYNQNRPIGLFTLNETWECKTFGLSKLVKNNKQIVQYNYPTKDMAAPVFIDLLRAVRDLENRDRDNIQVAFVHCKAGRGRSATVLAAYAVHLIYKADKCTTVDKVEAYLVAHRKQVRLHKEQKMAVANFYNHLKMAGSFENLYEMHKKAVEKRDKEIGR